MGIFSPNRLSGMGIMNIEEAVGYEDIAGVQEAMLESYENQYKIFAGTIAGDIQEAQMIHDGADEDSIMAFSESVLGDLIGKLKEFFKKLWSKIKAIFRGFMAKIDSVFMKSNKEFVNKYKSEVLRKDLTDFEVKLRKKKDNVDFGIETDIDIRYVDPEFNYTKQGGAKDVQKDIDDFDHNDQVCAYLNDMFKGLNISEPKEFDKEIMDHWFEDEDSCDLKDLKGVNNVMNELIGFKDAKKGINESNKKFNKWINDIVKKLDREENDVIKKFPVDSSKQFTQFKSKAFSKVNKASDASNNKSTNSNTDIRDIDLVDSTARSGSDITDKDTLEKYQKAVRFSSMHATALQGAISKATAATLKGIKFDNSQWRKAFAAMVAYRKKSEDTLFTEAFMELAEYEADCVGVY